MRPIRCAAGRIVVCSAMHSLRANGGLHRPAFASSSALELVAHDMGRNFLHCFSYGRSFVRRYSGAPSPGVFTRNSERTSCLWGWQTRRHLAATPEQSTEARRRKWRDTGLYQWIHQELDGIRSAGLYKSERRILSPQAADVVVESPETNNKPRKVLNFCANNYLGLANHPEIKQSARDALDSHGFGVASVRFICGTQDLHKELERKISTFHDTEDTILYHSCFGANEGLFEVLLGPEDAILSDELNHASIIDGVRLCKARRYRYRHLDMEDLERQLEKANQEGARHKLIATDGVFSMDGDVAPLEQICFLADQYDAIVMVDDCHATGFVGAKGRGTPELCGVMDRVDIVTSTLGKALGGGAGGYTTGRKEIIEILRQRSRPYLFSNALPPSIVAGSLTVFDMLMRKRSPASGADTARSDGTGASTTETGGAEALEASELRARLARNTRLFRTKMGAAGFRLGGEWHPIVPVMIGDAQIAADMAKALLEEGIYVVGFSYPVVPRDKARIRVQISAAHSTDDIEQCVAAFAKVGKEKKLIP